MPITISDYCSVAEMAEKLGMQVPTSLALLPRNFDAVTKADELLHESAVSTVRVLFRQGGLKETPIEPQGAKIPSIQENEFSLLLPTIFVSFSLLSENPHLVSVALNLISNYAYDFFKGIGGRKKVRLKIVVEQEQGKLCKRIDYEGDAEGINDLKDIVGKVFRHDR